jgi:hypothetical protein
MMGGDVTEPGKGSVFTVRLPSGGHPRRPLAQNRRTLCINAVNLKNMLG